MGNGMTLGLTNGSDYAGLGMHTLQTTNGYGKNVGASASQYGISTYKTIGVTPDPTKSGIVASLNGIDIGAVNSLKLGKYVLKY